MHDVEVGGHAGQRLEHPQKEVGPDQHAAGEQPLGLGPGRSLHNGGGRSFRTEGQGREQVGAEIDGQDLHDGQRQGDIEDDVTEVGNQFRDVGGEDIGAEAADVFKDTAPLLDGMHDGGEVVVQ